MIDPPRRLVFTWIWDHQPSDAQLIELEFRELDGRTTVVMTNSSIPSDQALRRVNNAGGIGATTISSERWPGSRPDRGRHLLGGERRMEGVVGGTGAAGGVRSSLSMHTASGMAMSMGLGLRTDLGSLGWFIGIWATMMGAMMLPPVMRAATSAHRATRVAGSQASALAFAVGYMVVWTASGLVGYGGIDAIQPVVPSWKHGGRYVAAVVLLGAAAFELTPLKASCLKDMPRLEPLVQV